MVLTKVANCLAPWLSQYVDYRAPKSPRTSWLPEAIHHPALLHATFLAAAVHLRRVQRQIDQTVAVWCRMETLRLLNQNLCKHSESASGEEVMCAMVLLYFTVSFCLYEAFGDLLFLAKSQVD
jgi:hypothetical protein